MAFSTKKGGKKVPPKLPTGSMNAKGKVPKQTGVPGPMQQKMATTMKPGAGKFMAKAGKGRGKC